MKEKIDWIKGKTILQDYLDNEAKFNPEQKQAVQRVLVEYSNGDLTALLINRIDCLLYSLAKKYLPPESED